MINASGTPTVVGVLSSVREQEGLSDFTLISCALLLPAVDVQLR